MRLRQYISAVIFGLLLLGAQLIAIYREMAVGLASGIDGQIQQQLLTALLNNSAALGAIAAYVVMAVLAHVAMTVLAVVVYRIVTGRLKPHWRERSLPLLAFMLLWVLVATFWNRYFFPASRAFPAAELLMVQPASPILVWGGTLVVLMACAVALYLQVKRYPKVVLGSAVLMGFALWVTLPVFTPRTPSSQPDVIVLGIDSLRPDLLRAYGEIPTAVMPEVDGALASMVRFDDVLTPLARTFVSYTSVLKGQNPRTHGVRFNLYPRTEFSTGDSLASRMQRLGYHTVMAMDESRFANFDESFGFNDIVMPEAGALDFILGSSFDLLGTNFLLKLPLLHRLFPHVSGNRAAYTTYLPVDHPERVGRALAAVPAEMPLFLISHLCLPHWPYEQRNTFAGESEADLEALAASYDVSLPYLRALRSADHQFSATLAQLRSAGRLDNAVLVIMSDHGESFGGPRDSLSEEGGSGRRVSFGHGGFALSDRQNRVVLGMQRFENGRPIWASRNVSGDVSLIDLAPSLLDALGADAELARGFEGESLLPVLANERQAAPSRPRFVESGLRSAGAEKAQVNEGEVAREMSHLYRATPDLRLEIRPESLLSKLREKQRGVVWQGVGVSTFPARSEVGVEGGCWIVVDYAARSFRCADFPDADLQVADLQRKVCKYFESDAGFEGSWCAE